MMLNGSSGRAQGGGSTATGAEIVIGSDGTVLATVGDVLPELVDRRLEDCHSLPREVLTAGKCLLQQLHRSGTRVAVDTVVLDGGFGTIRLVAIEALPIRRTKTDIRMLLASKLAVIASQATAVHVALRVAVADEVPTVVQLDSEKVAWAVTTLVGNALRYLQVGTHRMSGRTINVRVGFEPTSSDVTIEVEDDGLGIPADTATRLFKRDGLDARGAGLALLIMADICAAHGGTIALRSTTAATDHGTTVRLTLPTY